MTNTRLAIATTFGTDLSSRARAVELRNRVAEAAASGTVFLDFEGVRTLSDSFADELFGILAQRQGVDWFREHLQLTNLSPEVRDSVLEAVHSRLAEGVAS